MNNNEVAEVLYEIADILELQGISFKPQAYRRAARSLESLEEDVSVVAEEDRLRDIPGVGEAIAEKITELVETGKLSYLEKLRSEIPEGLVELLSIPDVGPKTAMQLHKELGISNIAELKSAINEHKLRSIKGLGERSEERILQGIKTLESKGERMLLGEAYSIAESYVGYLKSELGIDAVIAAGSLRRAKETVGDIDILVSSHEPEMVMDAFVEYDRVSEVLLRGSTKSSVLLKGRIQVDLRVVEEKNFGAALLYFTGSKDHNVSLRGTAIKAGFKLNEYGLFDRDSDELVAGAAEDEVYKALGLEWIPPEIRENTGEIEAAADGEIPELVEYGDVKGDFHVHTDWSDGSDTINGVVEEAISRGYSFVAITDHSQALKITHGLTPDRLEKQIREISKVKDDREGEIMVLAGCEVDIKPDGKLDFKEEVLEQLDIVIGSVHSKFKMEKVEMTKRIVDAIESGWVDILGHPTGRLIGQRDPYALNLEEMLEAARRAGTAVEVNSYPNRLDLNGPHCRLAKEHGVNIAIGTDAHRLRELDYLRFGTATARKGWLTAKEVLNTLAPKDIEKWLGRRRK